MEDAFEVRVEHGVEVLFLHAHEQAVARDARVVHENVDRAEHLRDGCDHPLDLRAVGDIRLKERGLAADCLDGRLRLLRLRGVARVVDGDRCALSCEPQRDGAADAAGRARDKCGLSI